MDDAYSQKINTNEEKKEKKISNKKKLKKGKTKEDSPIKNLSEEGKNSKLMDSQLSFNNGGNNGPLDSPKNLTGSHIPNQAIHKLVNK
jgi:hypothetical protein